MKDYIGIRFLLTCQYADTLKKLFENINIEKYMWYVKNSENYVYISESCDSFLPDGIYDGNCFRKIINTPEHYIHLLSLYGVPIGKNFDINTISNYCDYFQSNAEIAMFSGDGMVDFYSKNINIIKTVYKNCKNNNGNFINSSEGSIELFTIDQNTRAGFYV